MKSGRKINVALCPDCEMEIHVEAKLREGQNLTCPECWAYLKVVSTDPLELDWDMNDDEEEEEDDDDEADCGRA